MNLQEVSRVDKEVCSSLQEEEFEVLKSIYPDYLSNAPSSGAIKLDIPVEFDIARPVEVLDEYATDPSPVSPTLSLTALPPLIIELTLTESYPLRTPPSIERLRAMDDWFPRISDLQKLLIDMWTPGVGVLFTWVELIRSGDFLASLQMTSGESVRILHPTPQIVWPLLNLYDDRVKYDRFLNDTYSCSICLMEHKGSSCLRLTCSHIFGRSCLGDFWGLCVSEGEINRITCPDPACMKEGRQLAEEDLGKVLSEGQMARWRILKEKVALEKDPFVLNCPMSHCQALVSKPFCQDEDSGWARLRTCPKCNYSFCASCLRTWHGPISACPIADKLVLDYLALAEDSDERLMFEKRYGRNLLTSLVARYQEEKHNAEWLKANTRTCPHCSVSVERSLGCNHMTCAKCSQHFCYRCGEKLDALHPYEHFQVRGRSCYNRVFDIEE